MRTSRPTSPRPFNNGSRRQLGVPPGLGRLAEFFAVATRKLGLSAASARRRVEIYAGLEVFRPSVDDLLAAIDLHRLHEVSIWDALIIRSALASGCTILYTEDLQHDQTFDGLRIFDPFRD